MEALRKAARSTFPVGIRSRLRYPRLQAITLANSLAGKMNAHLDSIDGDPSPVLRVSGWADDPGPLDITLRWTDGATSRPRFLFRVPRADVVMAGASTLPFPGFVAEFDVSGRPEAVTFMGVEHPVPNAERFGTVEPHYGGLLTTERVFGRADIYGHGPPTDANPDVVALCQRLDGPVLDFGCGNGDLLMRLRDRGLEASGIELDTPRINAGLRPAARDHVILYDGALPLPYADGAFMGAVATEVLEHIPEPRRIAEELARVCRGRLLVTVPDMTCIPSGYQTGMVPWHLLEDTHVNFFTPRSLTALFRGLFTPAEYFRIGDSRINGHYVPGSVAVLFQRD